MQSGPVFKAFMYATGYRAKPNGRENMERLEGEGQRQDEKRSIESHIMYGADAFLQCV